ncbi:ubiquitin-associated protein 1-like [Tiliqua scincoides]|uniref:ubiquitin-associated protein 1-like n=1 Tax=Tiliqua scincoides TaxID=71010 RepID=UPI003461C1AC
MNCLEDVPFRMTANLVDDSVGGTNFVHAPEFEMPNCEEVLMCAMHDFSLEKKVLYWIESASHQDTPWYKVTTDVVPTAPPCWLLLVDPKENLVASQETSVNKVKDMTPVRRCMSLATAIEKSSSSKDNGRRTDKVNEDRYSEEDECSENEESSSEISEEKTASDAKRTPGTLPRFPSLPQCRPKTSPGLLAAPPENSCPNPPLLKQRRSVLLFNNMKNELEGAKRKLVEATLPSRAFSLHQRSRSSRNLRYRSTSDVSMVGALTPTPPLTRFCSPRPLTNGSLVVPPIRKHKPTTASLSPYSCLPPPPGAQQSSGSHRTHPDSTADLLSALSQEERDLIEPVLALGYPIRRAILALQKTGRQSLGQFLSYLSACDKLLKQGYEEAQVEEAMEMFQNSEKKAAEFLHLLAQFNDMGFQQADIKEVLLLCENHRDKALEELMTPTQ